MTRLLPFVVLGAWVLAAAFAPPAQAQFGGLDEIDAGGTAYFTFARQGEATVQVLVLGSVGSAGIYVVGARTTLDQLLALTGGPALSSSGEARTEVIVRLFHETDGRRVLAYEAPLERMLAEPGLYPPLQDGDVFTIESVQRRRISWRDALNVLTGLTTISILIRQIARGTS